MAILVWIKSRNVFLKIQKGDFNNLANPPCINFFNDYLAENDVDDDDNYDDCDAYVLWSTFAPKDLCIDEEMEMELIGSGMLLGKSPMKPEDTIKDCYLQAYDEPLDMSDVIPLLTQTEE